MRTLSSTSSTDRAPRLPAALARRIALPRKIARREGRRLFLVGGAVRDLMLGLPVRDLDLAVEGDAAVLARSLGAALGVPARVHARFGTATLETPAGRLDLAATRRETYDRPGALPRVAPAPIEEDLFRRDFTVNAMALEIAPARRVRLLDPFGGREDIERRRLRILHAGSFEDDPTRAFRAARYANRLRFAVEPETRRAARAAVGRGVFDAISGDRRRREVRLLFSEPNRAGAAGWMGRLDLPEMLHPALASDGKSLARLRAAERLAGRLRGDTSYILYLLAWAAGLGGRQARELADRLSLAGQERRALCSWPGTLSELSRPGAVATPSEVARLRLSREELAAAAVCCAHPSVRSLLRNLLDRPPIELAIRGRDLVAAGVSPGPMVGKALARTLAARRDGRIGREKELDFALEAARLESS